MNTGFGFECNIQVIYLWMWPKSLRNVTAFAPDSFSISSFHAFVCASPETLRGLESVSKAVSSSPSWTNRRSQCS